MKKKILTALHVFACCTLPLSAQIANAADKPKQLSVGYFLEWPTANQIAQVNKTYDQQLGVKVNWLPFESGTAMSAAMASGDVDVVYSQGLVPFTIAVSQGLPITMIGVAVSYAENDNCVVNENAGITSASAKKLEGQRVAVPFGTVAHYKMLKVLEHLDVDTKAVRLLDMPPADSAAALARGDVSMACGWGGALRRMKQYGDVLMSASDQEAIGIRVFDVISASNRFIEQYPELVTQFLQVTNDANKAYKDNPVATTPIIAKAAGLSVNDANQILQLFDFPLHDQQISEKWLGGTVQAYTKEVADFFVSQKQMPKALDDYSKTIDVSFYAQVK